MFDALKDRKALEVATFEGGYDRNFCYLLWCRDTRICALVDAATPTGSIHDAIQEKGLSLKRVLVTHTHGDHLAMLEAPGHFPDCGWRSGYHGCRVCQRAVALLHHPLLDNQPWRQSCPGRSVIPGYWTTVLNIKC